MKYYYLAASLPSFSIGENPPISRSRFEELCGEHLCRRDLQALKELNTAFEREPANAVVREWRDAETRLRNNAAVHRALRLQRDSTLYLREQTTADLYTEKEVNDAFAHSNPLARETALDRIRWRHADELAGHDPFDCRAILAYWIKLRLAERWAAMSDEEGSKKTDDIVYRRTEREEEQAED